MSEEINKIINKKSGNDPKMAILVLQICAAVVFILFAVVIRLIGGDFYEKVRNIYYGAVSTDTTVSSVAADDTKTAGEAKNQADKPIGTANLLNEVETVAAVKTLELVDEDSASNSETTLKKEKEINTIIWPVEGPITSGFGYRNDPFTGKLSFHSGIDIAVKTGTQVKTVAAGKVCKAEYSDNYGYYLIVDHTNGFMTLYAHCSKLCVKKGDSVAGGQTIALSGSTGRSTGPHLHFETILGGYKSNPMWLLPEI
ncbi:MAG: M23 family metallopeptidase [bacterium]|nr:M23 family metallopeptidase [bacterium]